MHYEPVIFKWTLVHFILLYSQQSQQVINFVPLSSVIYIKVKIYPTYCWIWVKFLQSFEKCSILTPDIRKYCKSGNIRGTLIFAYFAQIQQARIQKPAKNICNILYAHFGHIGVVYWPYVLMQMGYILKSVWDLLCFCAAQLHTYM